MTAVRSPAEDSSSGLCVQDSSEAYPAFYPMDAEDPFPGGKARPERNAYHSTPFSTEVKNVEHQKPLSPLSPAWRWRDILTFYSVQTGSGANPASFPVGTAIVSPREIKAVGA